MSVPEKREYNHALVLSPLKGQRQDLLEGKMGETYEALERAQEEGEKINVRQVPGAQKAIEVMPLERSPLHVAMERYEDLKANLLTRYPKGSLKVILFNSTSQGSGCSTTAATFAAALARDRQLKVLLVDTNLRTPGLHKLFKIPHAPGLSDIFYNGDKTSPKIKQVGPKNLYVLPCGERYSGATALFENGRFDKFLRIIRERFDYIILDAPAVPRFSECQILCAKVDGVVLVIESGKTRRQVVLRAKKELEEAGGKLLGVVLNRRRYHIPEWIYRRL